MLPTEYMGYLIGLGVGLSLVICFLIFRHLVEEQKKRETDRLIEKGDDFEEPLFGDMGNAPTALDKLVSNTGLEMNGWQALGWMMLLGAVLGSGMFLVRPDWWMFVTGFAIGAAFIYFSFHFFKAYYRSKLRNQLPDTLYLLSRSLRAGLSLEQAMKLVGTQGLQPLAGEFQRCTSQVSLGLPMNAALENMSSRLQLTDFNAFVSAVSLFQQTGGNLPSLLDRLASSSRDHLKFRAYFQSATAMGRISAYAIGLAGPVLFIVYAFMDPEYVSIFFTSRLGMLLFFTGLGLEIVGIIWIRLLLRSEY